MTLRLGQYIINIIM